MDFTKVAIRQQKGQKAPKSSLSIVIVKYPFSEDKCLRKIGWQKQQMALPNFTV
jgi:hypothetical protein